MGAVVIKFIYRHNKDYSRYNIIKQMTANINTKKDVYVLMAFSKNQFLKHFFKRDKILNDFFISNYDTYVHDRKKITNKNPRAWWKFIQDWINFRFSKYLISDTNEHFKYWESLFGKFKGRHFVLPVLADKTIYYPSDKQALNEPIKILFYGSFIPLHGIDIILKSFKILEEHNIPFQAELIGNGQTFKTMKELYNSLELKQVKMDGELLKENDLANKIRKADIVLGIFGSSVKAKSVIPNKVYQSTACKKCTVTMTSNTLSEFYNDDDLAICENNPKDLSSTLEYLINNPNEINSIANSGYKTFNLIYNKAQNDLENLLKDMENSL